MFFLVMRTFKIYSLSSFQICNTELLFLFIYYLFLAVLVFTAVHWLSLVAVSRGYSLVVMRGLLIAVASLFCRARALRCAGFSNCGVRAWQLPGWTQCKEG